MLLLLLFFFFFFFFFFFLLLLLLLLLLLFLFGFFTPVLTDGFSLEFEWQQVSSSLQDSSQYSGRSQQCCSLDGLHSFSYFQVLQSLYQSFCDSTKSANYNWYNRHFHVPLSSIPSQSPSPYLSFRSLLIFLFRQPRQQSLQFCEFSFFVVVDYCEFWSPGRD